MRMIDIHCHLLPEIDDGAKTLDQALAMARAAVDDGIEFSVMTPHIHPGRYDNTRTRIELRTRSFRNALKAAKIPLRVGMAAEVRLAPEILRLIDQDEIPFYGELDGFRIMLLEFPHTHIPPGSDNLVDRLLRQGIRPIIAHPERNKDVIRDLRKILPFIEMGCMLQLTAGAVAGGFGEGPHERALEILEMDVFKILATDSHNLAARSPQLTIGRQAAAEIIGEEAANDLVYANPLALVRSQFEADTSQDDEDPERHTKTMVDEDYEALDSIKRKARRVRRKGRTPPAKAEDDQAAASPQPEVEAESELHEDVMEEARGQAQAQADRAAESGVPEEVLEEAQADVKQSADLSLKRSAEETAGERAEETAEAAEESAESALANLAFCFEERLVFVRNLQLDGQKYMLGRQNNNDIVLNDENVSRRHALLFTTDNKLAISDLKSTNGIRVNEKRVHARRLKDGDVVRIGKFTIEIRIEEAGKSSVVPAEQVVKYKRSS